VTTPTANPQSPPIARSPAKAEAVAQIIIMLAIGAAAGAASFTHVHDLAAAHRQGGWLAWADAVVLELMSLAAGLELRRRRRTHTRLAMPATVLVCAVSLSLAAQVIQAEASLIGWIAAAIPAAGFLTMVKIALGALGHPPSTPATPAGVASTADAITPTRPHRTVPTPPVSAVADRPLSAAAAPIRTTVPDTVLTDPADGAPTDTTRHDVPATAKPSPRHGDDTQTNHSYPDTPQMPAKPTPAHKQSARTDRPPRARNRTGGTGRIDRLLPAAQQAAAALTAAGEPVSRDRLADALRQQGYALSNTHAGQLLKTIDPSTPHES
jgi:hypothetical protein